MKLLFGYAVLIVVATIWYGLLTVSTLLCDSCLAMLGLGERE